MTVWQLVQATSRDSCVLPCQFTRSPLSWQAIRVRHDRNPVFVRLSDGAIRNAYTVRIANKRAERREFALAVSGLAGSLLDVVPAREDGRVVVEVGPDQTREVRVLVTDYA